MRLRANQPDAAPGRQLRTGQFTVAGVTDAIVGVADVATTWIHSVVD